ncbi:MAG: DMT family transporter [Deltaproteobacteria bacterium]|nr:DMT family transporter [Deltaproteobacteria bacterium]
MKSQTPTSDREDDPLIDEPPAAPAKSRSLLHSGIAWMLVAQVLFSLMSVFTRMGARHVPWMEVAAARFVIGALIAWGFAMLRGASLRIENRRVAWVRTIFGTGSALAIFYTLSSPRIPLGDAVTLNSTGPVFVALLSWPLIGERVSRAVFLAVPLSIVGVALVVKPSFDVALQLAAISTAGAMSYGVAMIYLRRLGKNESHEAIVLHFSVFGAIVMIALSIPVWVTPDPAGLAVLALTGISAGFGQLAMTRAYSLDRAATISALSYLGIIITHVMAIPMFGERTSPIQWAGSLLVIVAGVVLAFATRRASAPGFAGARVGTR